MSVEEHIRADVSAPAPALDLHEIQATVLRLWPAPYFGTHVVLPVDDARGACDVLPRLIPHVDSPAKWWDAHVAWLSIGIRYAGLEAIGLSRDSLQSFPEAFRDGMAARAEQLRDAGVNAPKNWDKEFGAGQAHIGLNA